MDERNRFLERVVYQIYPKSFYSAGGTDTGDLQGIIQKLDYLKGLGVGVIWLCPVYASPEADNGYDISDYCSIHPRYGSMADMDELIAAARARDIYIMMDLVINHTSDAHPWFVQSKNPDSEYRAYYIWRTGRGKHGQRPPNNWTGFFGGRTWTRDRVTGEWYLHLFTERQPDLNWHNPMVLAEVKRIMRFWLDKGIAGFRCDVINIIFKDTLQNGRRRLILTGSEQYLTRPGCHAILRRLRREVLDEYDCFTVGETVFATLRDANELTAGDGGPQELDMVFSFAHMEVDQILVKWLKVAYRPEKMKRVLQAWQEGLPWNALYFENHDQPRSISRFGASGRLYAQSGKMLATLLLTLRGTPFIYQGQELGMLNADYTRLDEYKDVESQNVYRLLKKIPILGIGAFKKIQRSSRDNARTPMQWDDSANAGFTTGTPWLTVNGNYRTVNAAAAAKDKDSIFQFYKDLIAIRRESAALTAGGIEFLPAPRTVMAYKRTHGDERVFAVVNLGGKPVSLTRYPQLMRLLSAATVILSNDAGGRDGMLAAYESVIFR